MTKRLFKWTVQAALAVVGVLGAHDIAAAPGAWLYVLAEYPWIAVVLTFSGGVGVTLALQDIWRSRLPHRTLDRLAGCAWAVRQFFLGNLQSGHVRAYYLPISDGEEPPDPICITSRAGVRLKRPWRPILPSDVAADDEFWVATTFIASGVDGVFSVLPPSKMKVWGLVYGARNDLHTDRRSTDRYMRYRLPPDGRYSPLIHLGRAPAQEWKELCHFNVSPHNEDCRAIPLEMIDLAAVSELLFTITLTDTGLGSVRHPPSAVFSRVDDLQTVPASEDDPDKDRMLYCHLSEGGSSAAIGRPRNVLPASPSGGIMFGLTFRQVEGSAKDSVTDTLLFYHPGGNRRPYGWLSVDWR